MMMMMFSPHSKWLPFDNNSTHTHTQGPWRRRKLFRRIILTSVVLLLLLVCRSHFCGSFGDRWGSDAENLAPPGRRVPECGEFRRNCSQYRIRKSLGKVTTLSFFQAYDKFLDCWGLNHITISCMNSTSCWISAQNNHLVYSSTAPWLFVLTWANLQISLL